ncbi:GDP-D-glucose phosphorylase 1-like [Limulus polyphemus]|uniref:GDP-D-glucose phosphorylase 1 n=1 Tax=Limulus polyphemus TaxID=6850 RepID=A0ABM1TBB3_LIMPO|nr:GDP-D-glucose phosphorylase 1-like [Limulus polyphemus]XP_022253168.1 GDP-D-glucose phosphorylase 1-like [Limulus polyphemus]XP_022253169.1 GDP-D-glucose phosphorylase 1-like [Limulus polyphemus]
MENEAAFLPCSMRNSSEEKEFSYTGEEFIFQVPRSFIDRGASKFDQVLQRKWEAAMKKKYFRYHLDKLETKVLPGKYGFVAQLNVKRAQERRKPQDVVDLEMPFNPNLFNFTKVKQHEVLFSLNPNQEAELSSHQVIINVSPLEYCNCLLVPFVNSCLPQVVNESGLQLAVEMLLLSADPSFRVGFNSLGAYASVNHYHFHLYYLSHHLFIEITPVQHLSGLCYEVVNYPGKGFVFQLLQNSQFTVVLKSVMKVIKYLLDESIAHNILITRGQRLDGKQDEYEIYEAVRIFVWARKSSFGVKNDEAFNPALCELGGHLPIKNERSFQNISEAAVASILDDVCSEAFFKVREHVKQICDV